jgi:hypothetical protein
MNQKTYANWNLGATYYLTTAFTATVFKIIFSLIFTTLPLKNNQILLVIVSFIITSLAIWLSARTTANWMNKKYIINDKDKIINFSLIYLVMMFLFSSFVLPGFLYGLLRWFTLVEIHTFKGIELFIQIIQSVLVFCLFFVFSKKYLKNSPQQ